MINKMMWQQVAAFRMEDDQSALSFTQRLARENGWSQEFARRVVEEYRRFIYLAVNAGHPVTPSDEVDQAWHLHLVYTRSYWEDLCRDVLGKPLHHGPTKGGRQEADKFSDWYARTLASYRSEFGQEPPSDIWPPAARRFSPSACFQRVNLGEAWVISRARVWQGLKLGMGAALLATLLMACARDGGGDGGWWVVGIWLFAVVLIAILSNRNKPPGRRGRGSNQASSGGCSSFISGCSSGTGSSGNHSGCGAHHGGSGCGADSGCGGSSGCGSSCGGGGCGGGGD